MIATLRLQNFRGFEDHTVPLRSTTVLVGANNAGKSTIVEALRLINLVAGRLTAYRAAYVEAPAWLARISEAVGVAPTVRGLPTDGFEVSLFHGYGEPPAVVTATFANGARVVAFVGPDALIHGVAFDRDGVEVAHWERAGRLGLAEIAVQPQVAPLLREEKALRPATVERGEGTHLAPQHFRNQLALAPVRTVQEFVTMAAETWPGLQIRETPDPGTAHGERLALDVRDGAFVGEVRLMGHGLQMWLQIVWFLARAPRDAVVILDEPDVYMHPDLQRRLLGLVRRRFRQLLIATHSIEIISDVDPQAILSVDRSQRTSQFVASLPNLQDVINALGTVQNIDLARLMRSRSFCLVEGEDLEILRILQTIAVPEADPIDLVPGGQLGGRGGWGSGVARRLPTRNGEGKRVRSYAILDRDYFPDDEVEERLAEAQQWKVGLHVWSRKELENFLLVPAAIARYVAEHSSHPDPPSEADVVAEMDRYMDSVKEDVVFDAMVEVLLPRYRRGGPSTANKAARKRLNAAWETFEGRTALVPGKALLKHLSDWAKRNYGAQFRADQIARTLQPEEVSGEVLDVVAAVVNARPMPSRARA